MSKDKQTEQYSLYERTRDATIVVSRKNRKLYDFLTYLGMIGSLICLLVGAYRFAVVCVLLTILFMNISLISRTKEQVLDSMVDEDQLERFFNKEK